VSPSVFNTYTDPSPNQEPEEVFDTLLNTIIDKAISCNKITGKEGRIEIETALPRRFEILQDSVQKSAFEYRVEQLKTALKNPSEMQGLISISINQERVFCVKDGEIIQDSLHLLSEQSHEKEIEDRLDSAFREVEGKNLLKYISTALVILGTESKEDNSMGFESKNYIFTEKNGQLSVRAKDYGQEVLNNDGFTEMATMDDITRIQGLEEVIKQLKEDNSQAQQPSFKL
jgi:hypothetical protein